MFARQLLMQILIEILTGLQTLQFSEEQFITVLNSTYISIIDIRPSSISQKVFSIPHDQ